MKCIYTYHRHTVNACFCFVLFLLFFRFFLLSPCLRLDLVQRFTLASILVTFQLLASAEYCAPSRTVPMSSAGVEVEFFTVALVLVAIQQFVLANALVLLQLNIPRVNSFGGGTFQSLSDTMNHSRK